MTVAVSHTLVEVLQASFAGSLRPPDGVADPVALLWTDADGQWRPLVPTLLKAVPQLYVLGPLRGRRLEADDFDRLAIGDPVRDLLAWMSDAESFEARCDAGRWATFRDVCVREFGFDPDRDGTQAAADALLQGGGKWDEVW